MYNIFNLDNFIQRQKEKYNLDVRTLISKTYYGKWRWDDNKINFYLKKCPFCGGEAESDNYEYDDGLTYVIVCKKCGATTNEYDELAGAIVNWNNRV